MISSKESTNKSKMSSFCVLFDGMSIAQVSSAMVSGGGNFAVLGRDRSRWAIKLLCDSIQYIERNNCWDIGKTFV